MALDGLILSLYDAVITLYSVMIHIFWRVTRELCSRVLCVVTVIHLCP